MPPGGRCSQPDDPNICTGTGCQRLWRRSKLIGQSASSPSSASWATAITHTFLYSLEWQLYQTVIATVSESTCLQALAAATSFGHSSSLQASDCML